MGRRCWHDRRLGSRRGRFLAHKRALGRKYRSEEATLRLLVAFADRHGVQAHQLESAVLDAFFASRPRDPAASFNQLVGIVGCFLDWAVGPGAAGGLAAADIPASPQFRPHPVPVRPRPGPAVCSTPRPACRTTPRPNSGDLPTAPSSLSATAWGCGPGRPVGCGWEMSTLLANLLVVRGGKFGKTRLVPHGPRIGELLAAQLDRDRRLGRTILCSASDAGTSPSTRARPARCSTVWSRSWSSPSPRACRHHVCTACATLSPSDASYAGIAKA